MKSISAKTLRKALIASIAALAMAALSPAALAGGHGRHGSYYGHAGYGHHGYGYRYARHGYRHSRHYSYRAPRRHYGYRHYRRHRHWGPGEVLGAVVAGAIITNVIADAFEPRTTVIERRVYRSDYPDDRGYYRRDGYNTRYIGRDDSYYDRRR